MCSVDDDGELFMISKQPIPLSEKKCRSCNNGAVVVLRKKDVYCKSCFLSSSMHKFRAMLGKSKMLKPGNRVLVIFTGSSSSLALLHFLHSGLNEETNKRFMFNVDVLYIDDGLVSGVSFEKRQEAVEEAKNIAKSFNFEILITTLSEILSDTPTVNKHLNVKDDLEDQIKEIFKNIKSITAKEDMLYQLRYKLTLKLGEVMGYDKVFTSEVGTDLAIKLLVGISLGRGDQISPEVGFCDNVFSKIAVLRPLKDFTQKEIIYYIIFQQIESMTMLSSRKMIFNDVSIQKTTEDFVNNLQEKFPSTVYTIFRTGDKLKTEECKMDLDYKKCMLCSKVIKNSAADVCDVIDALDFSRKISEVRHKKSALPCNDCSCTDENEKFDERRMEQFLCYGCTLILKDVERKDVFWRYLLKKEMHARNVQNLRNQVSEFLLD